MNVAMKAGLPVAAITALVLTLSGDPTPVSAQSATATSTTTATATATATASATATVTATSTATATATASPAATSTRTVPPGIGRIVSGNVPGKGFGLVVAAGRIADVVAASGCPAWSSAFWATVEGEFVGYVPGTTISAVNEAFMRAFPDGVLPENTPIIGKCS